MSMTGKIHLKDLVSIITPSYNTGAFIAETIKSVQAQTYANWEMIIVDDCSTDDTDKVIASFLSDVRIRYIKNEKKSGAALSRNRGLREAKGRWVAFLDSDDLWLPSKLMRQISFMEMNNYHFSYTDYMEIDDTGKSLGIITTGPHKINETIMKTFNYMGCLTVMYDRDYIGLIQIHDIKKRNDYAIWLKVVKKCPAFLLNECLGLYRVRSSGSLMDRKKSPIRRLVFNYRLWRINEQKGVCNSILLTGLNTVFGAAKKIVYKKKIKTDLEKMYDYPRRSKKNCNKINN